MNLKQLFTRKTISNISIINARFLSSYPSCCNTVKTLFRAPNPSSPFPHQNPSSPKPFHFFNSFIHSSQDSIFCELNSIGDAKRDDDLEEEEEGEDETMNEFLSRFVWIMRGKLSEVYTDADKNTIDGMLMIIVGKVVSEMEKDGLEQMIGSSAAAATPSSDLSEDLWKTVWEVSNMVLVDMEKAKKKEKLKKFLLADAVKEKVKFASEAGIRGDMLRELRFKWAREEMEEHEFYETLEHVREADAKEAENGTSETESVDAKEGTSETESVDAKEGTSETESGEAPENDFDIGKEKAKDVSLPKRRGKIKYKIYGLDLSDPKWAEVADKIQQTGELLDEPKPISGKCKFVTDKILSLQENEDPSLLLAEWVELLQPSRVDWIGLLDRLKDQNTPLYFKVAELVLGEESFQTNIRDYSKLVDAHAKQNRLEDAERILKKMNENGILPDILTHTIKVHMYSKGGNLERAIEAFKILKEQHFQPDLKLFTSMIMAYVNAGRPKDGEALMREMELRDITPTEEICRALLRSFAQRGDDDGARRIKTTMDIAGFPQRQEFCSLMVEAYGRASKPDDAEEYFDNLTKSGHKHDDKCIASLLKAYAKSNLLDKGLNLLLQQEKDGFELGVATYSVLVDWFSKLQLLDEAEEVLGKIAELGEVPPLEVHVSLCDGYARSGLEKKALQALGVLQAKKEQLKPDDFERIINALIDGGFSQDAQKVHELMEGQGFASSEKLKMSLRSKFTRPTMR